jgi:hypothetical protein
MINGPKGPFTNQPPGKLFVGDMPGQRPTNTFHSAIEAEVDFATDTIARAEKGSTKVVEATEEGEKWWANLCEGLASNSLFWKASENWIFGANIPGRQCLFLMSATCYW